MSNRPFRPLAILAGLAIPVCCLPVLAQEQGFLEDARTELVLRNYAFNRDFRDHGARRSVINEWAQGFILKFTSGYTAGTVGLGLDALGLFGVKLDSSPAHSGSELLPVHDDGEAADNYGRVAVAARLRVSASELKFGEMLPDLPVLRYDDGRLLPQSFRGAALVSREWEGLSLHGGRFDQFSLRNSSDMQGLTSRSAPTAQSDGFNYAGAEYRFDGEHTMLGAWYAQLEDIYTQRYFNLVTRRPTGDWVLGANLGLFVDHDDGRALAGEIDSRTAYALLSANRSGHTLYVGLQKMTGTGTWQSVLGTGGRSVGNDMFNGNFTYEDERSWQLRHDYDFAAVGVPGLVSMVRYGKGDNVTTSVVTGGKEWERDVELGYTVQSGVLQKLNVRLNHASNRRSFSHDFDQLRLIFNYPLAL